ncbi:MAG: RNA-binding S4 domain-containing protein [Magnetococcales bacterium]|nr:RNA-binding S4 domain-containing protein [Magnetococcales bacterium]
MALGTRLDKWLWAARFFKTRTLAQEAVSGGRVQRNGGSTSPGQELKPGDRLFIRREPFTFEIVVLALSEQRGPASVAATLYQETAESVENRHKQADEARLQARVAVRFHEKGRPTKRDRRERDRVFEES